MDEKNAEVERDIQKIRNQFFQFKAIASGLVAAVTLAACVLYIRGNVLTAKIDDLEATAAALRGNISELNADFQKTQRDVAEAQRVIDTIHQLSGIVDREYGRLHQEADCEVDRVRQDARAETAAGIKNIHSETEAGKGRIRLETEASRRGIRAFIDSVGLPRNAIMPVLTNSGGRYRPPVGWTDLDEEGDPILRDLYDEVEFEVSLKQPWAIRWLRRLPARRN